MAGLEIKHFDSPDETRQIDCCRPFFGSDGGSLSRFGGKATACGRSGGRVSVGGQLCGCAAWLLSGGGWAERRPALRARCWARSCLRVCWSCRLISGRAK